MAMSGIVAMWLFVSSMAFDEPNCLLQTHQHQQRQVPAPPGYEFKCGPNCRCEDPLEEETGIGEDPTIEQCGTNCQGYEGFIWTAEPVRLQCICCDNRNEVTDNVEDAYSFYVVPGPSVIGDPHIRTLDGKSYTLLKQGTFSLWHFAGLETDFHSKQVGKTKTVSVDWQVYAHYSGRQSFTKGLLLLDKSGGSTRQVLEITSENCEWKARKGNEPWQAITKAELITVPNGKDYVTGFNVSRTNVASGHKFPNQVHFNMNTKHGKKDIALMSLSCRPGHNINLKMDMTRSTDHQFVDGEMQVARKSLSALQSDSEFSSESKWQDLGGSEQAAAYFQLVDQDKADATLLQKGCDAAEESQAKETCSKHLGGLVGADDAMKDCIFDLCNGAGEIEAELAAELLATRAA